MYVISKATHKIITTKLSHLDFKGNSYTHSTKKTSYTRAGQEVNILSFGYQRKLNEIQEFYYKTLKNYVWTGIPIKD